MNINTVDLNLFLVFQAVYVTGSVTQAGERLGLTQSAVSAALKRMRERFNDPLFVRTVSGMVPTPLAQRLISPVDEGLARLLEALDQGITFDPETTRRTFRVAINDIGQLALVPQLLAEARQAAPMVRFETVDASVTEARTQMQSGQVDLAVGSWEPLGQSFYQQRVFDETFVLLMRRGHPLASTGVFLEDYVASEHVVYRPQGTTDTALQQTLERAGILHQRQVVLTAAHSLGLSTIVRTSDLLLTAPGRLAAALVSMHADLVQMPAPFAVTALEIRQQWHERFHQDAGNRWLRELVFRLFHVPSRRREPAHAEELRP